MELTLYQFKECPYCAKVRARLDEKGLKYTKIEMPYDEDPKWDLLMEKAGVETVPVLKADEKWIGDSAAILKFLDEKL
jgi:glutathione S-transferase